MEDWLAVVAAHAVGELLALMIRWFAAVLFTTPDAADSEEQEEE